MYAYKLLKPHRDGPGPLFINKRQRLAPGVWYEAEEHPTKGFAFRPGWHCTTEPVAPHLSENGREWWQVEVEGTRTYPRPESQGGTWILADRMRLVEKVAA